MCLLTFILTNSNIMLQSLEENCKGDYVNIDPNNTQCVSDYEAYSEVSMILFAFIVMHLVYSL